MKNYIVTVLVGALTLLSVSTKAQFGSAYVFPTIAGDSLINTDTVFKKITLSAGYSSFNIEAGVKKGTGTLNSKIYLYASMKDDEPYQLIDSSVALAVQPSFAFSKWTASAYTYGAVMSRTSPGYVNYIVAVTQTGTLTASPVVVSYTARPYFSGR